MRNISTFCFVLLGLVNLYAQSGLTPPSNDSNKVYRDGMEIENGYKEIQMSPKFPGNVMKYLADSIRYPEEARKKNIQGKVYVSFIVEKNGSISTVKVLRADDKSLINEAKRLIYAMPKWTAGKKEGKPVRVQETIVVDFKL